MAYKIGVVVVGAGQSQRMGADKIFLAIAGKPLLAWSVDICQNYELIDQITLVLNKGNLDSGQRLVMEMGWSKITAICTGGERRQDSVKQGLNKLRGCDWVIIHDGARPFLTRDLLKDGLAAAQSTGAAAAAVPVKDTIKIVNRDGIVEETLQRQQLWAVQTPQVFRSDIIATAHNRIATEVTDDASLVEKSGYKVKLYMGSYDNIKVTSPEDLAIAEFIAKRWGGNEGRNRL